MPPHDSIDDLGPDAAPNPRYAADEDSDDYTYDRSTYRTRDAEDTAPRNEAVRRAPSRLDRLAARLWWRLRGAIFVGAFLTPLLVLAGMLVALELFDSDDAAPQTTGTVSTAAPTLTATYAVSPQWPDIVYIPHSTPARIRDILDTASTKRGYQFKGTAGETWHIAVEAYDGSGATPIVVLFAPTGERLCQETGCAGEPRASITLTLSVNGAYRVAVESTGGAGLYLFTLDVE